MDNRINELSKSGIPFQKMVENTIKANEKNTNWICRQREIPLTPTPEYASRSFIPPSLDFMLWQTSRMKEFPWGTDTKWSVFLLFECKKAYEAVWYFYSKVSGISIKIDTTPLSGVVSEKTTSKIIPKIKTIPIPCPNIPNLVHPFKSPICVNANELKDRGTSGHDAIHEACGILSVGLMHFLNQTKEALDSRIRSGIFFEDAIPIVPCIITTARLHTIDSEKLNPNLTDGSILADSFRETEVGWVVYEFPILPSLQNKIENPDRLKITERDLAEKIGVIIVNAEHLIDFLKEFSMEYSDGIAYDLNNAKLDLLYEHD